MNKYRGHNIHKNNKKEWIFSDIRQLVSENIDRKCGRCGLVKTKEGHDSCLGTLEEVMNACCGHGIDSEAYVQFLDGNCIRGENAIIMINSLKGLKDESR